jgi:hypothetical protein
MLCYPNPSLTAPRSKKHSLSLILALSQFKIHWLAHGGEHGSELFLQRGVIWTQPLGRPAADSSNAGKSFQRSPPHRFGLIIVNSKGMILQSWGSLVWSVRDFVFSFNSDAFLINFAKATD